MSWGIFINTLNNKLGKGTNDRSDFVKSLIDEYDKSIKRHTDVMSGGNQFVTQKQPVTQVLDIWTKLNLQSPPQVVANVNILEQLKLAIPLYWVGAVITGPLGVTNILFPGIWAPVELKPNLDFRVMLSKISLLSALHLKTMFGTFTSTTTGLVVPWSGSSLLSP